MDHQLSKHMFVIVFLLSVLTGCYARLAERCSGPHEYKLIDQEEDCSISLIEWTSVVQRSIELLPPSLEREQLRRTQLNHFYQLDKDRNGTISVREWQNGKL